MTLEALKHHRLQEQVRTGLSRWKALIARGGYTEIVLPHAQFIWNWEHHPEARRWEFHSSPIGLPSFVKAVPEISEISLTNILSSRQEHTALTGAQIYNRPWLDLGLGVPVYSSWVLPPDDPCWEGQTYYPAGQPNSEIEAMWEQYPEIMRRCVLNGSLGE